MAPEINNRSAFLSGSAEGKIKDLNILIVDDEKYIREMLADMLTKHAHETEIASDGEEALKKLSIRHFDVIITDVKMPRMDGFTLLKNAKQLHPETAVVVMTAFMQDYSIREALSYGAEEYLTKPFRTEEVLMVIERAYWRNQARRVGEKPFTAL